MSFGSGPPVVAGYISQAPFDEFEEAVTSDQLSSAPQAPPASSACLSSMLPSVLTKTKVVLQAPTPALVPAAQALGAKVNAPVGLPGRPVQVVQGAPFEIHPFPAR